MSRIIISGLGLIGGSIGMVLRSRGRHVAYVDPAVAIEDALSAGAADERLANLSAATPDDVIVLATPVDVARTSLEELSTTGSLVTSVCSVMAPLAASAPRIRFVAGHPFAGSEQHGLAAARPDLFDGKPWFIDPAPGADAVAALARECGANPIEIDAARHDELLALTSHLPQLVSTALASVIVEREIPDEFIGSGLRTLLRLASSSHAVWQPVLDGNNENISAARALFERALAEASGGNAAAHFARANDFAVRGK